MVVFDNALAARAVFLEAVPVEHDSLLRLVAYKVIANTTTFREVIRMGRVRYITSFEGVVLREHDSRLDPYDFEAYGAPVD